MHALHSKNHLSFYSFYTHRQFSLFIQTLNCFHPERRLCQFLRTSINSMHMIAIGECEKNDRILISFRKFITQTENVMNECCDYPREQTKETIEKSILHYSISWFHNMKFVYMEILIRKVLAFAVYNRFEAIICSDSLKCMKPFICIWVMLIL